MVFFQDLDALILLLLQIPKRPICVPFMGLGTQTSKLDLLKHECQRFAKNDIRWTSHRVILPDFTNVPEDCIEKMSLEPLPILPSSRQAVSMWNLIVPSIMIAL